MSSHQCGACRGRASWSTGSHVPAGPLDWGRLRAGEGITTNLLTDVPEEYELTSAPGVPRSRSRKALALGQTEMCPHAGSGLKIEPPTDLPRHSAMNPGFPRRSLTRVKPTSSHLCVVLRRGRLRNRDTASGRSRQIPRLRPGWTTTSCRERRTEELQRSRRFEAHLHSVVVSTTSSLFTSEFSCRLAMTSEVSRSNRTSSSTVQAVQSSPVERFRGAGPPIGRGEELLAD